jgi:hypothetical protein
MDQLISHYERVIREAGFIILKALLTFNGFGAVASWGSLGNPAASGAALQSAAVLFLLGIVAALAAAGGTWLVAQIGINGQVISTRAGVLLLIAPPVLSLIFFASGFWRAIWAFSVPA